MIDDGCCRYCDIARCPCDNQGRKRGDKHQSPTILCLMSSSNNSRLVSTASRGMASAAVQPSNATSTAAITGIGWVRTTVNNFLIVDQSTQDYTSPSGVSAVLMHFSDWWCLIQFRSYSPSSVEVVPNRVQIFTFLGPKFQERGAPKFLTQFFKLHSLSNMRGRLVAINRGTSEITRWKKQQQNIMVCPYYRKGDHN